MRELVVVCTGAGTHDRRELARIQVRAGRQIFHDAPKGEDGNYAGYRRYVGRGRDQQIADDAEGFVKGTRAICPSCPIDVVLRDETVGAWFRQREDVWRQVVDVSQPATLHGQ